MALQEALSFLRNLCQTLCTYLGSAPCLFQKRPVLISEAPRAYFGSTSCLFRKRLVLISEGHANPWLSPTICSLCSGESEMGVLQAESQSVNRPEHCGVEFYGCLFMSFAIVVVHHNNHLHVWHQWLNLASELADK